jgi:hypothetical protein
MRGAVPAARADRGTHLALASGKTEGQAVTSRYYEIRVSGLVPPEALVDFERLTATVEPVETVLHGPLADQAALTGLLQRLELLGVQVVEVRRLHGHAPET